MADCISDILSEKAKERFWDNVSQAAGNDECWPWLGQVDRDGYGKFSFRVPGKRYFFRSSQVALILSGVERPHDRHALHACDNPPCCNPNHLRWGTQRDNTSDMVERDRHGVIKNVLTVSQITQIRKELNRVKREVAQRYNVHPRVLERVLYAKHWESPPAA